MHIAIAYLPLGENNKAIDTLETASKMDSPIFPNRVRQIGTQFSRQEKGASDLAED